MRVEGSGEEKLNEHWGRGRRDGGEGGDGSYSATIGVASKVRQTRGDALMLGFHKHTLTG